MTKERLLPSFFVRRADLDIDVLDTEMLMFRHIPRIGKWPFAYSRDNFDEIEFRLYRDNRRRGYHSGR